MISIEYFAIDFGVSFPNHKSTLPWEIVSRIKTILIEMLENVGNDFITGNGIAIHKSAIVHHTAILHSPVIINENSYIGPYSFLRNGVYLGRGSTIGPACEIKSSIILNHSTAAHFNFIGDSIIGNNVNLEAGSHIANHFNERKDKLIQVIYNNEIIETQTSKFGAVVGDNSCIGANAVLSPGTLMNKNSIVKRLELIQQIAKK